METNYERLYEKIIKIRAFEEYILKLFGQNMLSGTTHTYIGEEATAVAIMEFVKSEDTIFSNHRCHGHYLAYGGPEEKLFAEIMSKESGICQGRGGSQHIHYKKFYTNGIQGGIVPNALGVAMADKMQNRNANTIVFLGDGTLGQGVVYESLNIAAVYNLPVVFVVEDNQYAMSTKRSVMIAGDIKHRIEGFDIKTFDIESTDIEELLPFFAGVFEYVSEVRKPVCAVVHNYRLAAHSKGDDTRDAAEIAEYEKKDPALIAQQRIGEEKYNQIYNKYYCSFEQIVEKLKSESNIAIKLPEKRKIDNNISFQYNGNERCVELIRAAFKNELSNRNNVVFFGEDIREPYGGSFKATKGLSDLFDERVLNMPISEACMVGMAVGMALNKMIPVVEMMFGDFITLGFDQLLNHATKYSWVYGDKNIQVPMIIRLPMGAKRGYGPTHSQSLEKFLMGIPFLNIIALSPLHSPLEIYKTIFQNINLPTAVIENKKMYSERLLQIKDGYCGDFEVDEINQNGFSTFHLSFDLSEAPDYYLITYGGMVKDALDAATCLMMKYDIAVDIIVLSQLSPLPIDDIQKIVKKNSVLVTVEEGTRTNGIGSEIIAQCVDCNIGSRYIRIATPDLPIPNGLVLENQVVPNSDTIIKKLEADYNEN